MPTFVPWGTEGATEPRNTAAVDDVAHRLVRCLQAEGVEYVFGIRARGTPASWTH